MYFTPVTPSAKYDSAITDINGDYSKILASGVYSVKFIKNGFLTKDYIQTIFVNGNLVLNPVELLNSVVKSVSGKISGVWTKDTIYSIVDYAFVPQNDSLIVMPGVSIFTNHNIIASLDISQYEINSGIYKPIISVLGKLKIIGTDSEPIIIKPTSSDNSFSNLSFETSNNLIFDHVKFLVHKINIINSQLSSNQFNVISNCDFVSFGLTLVGNNRIINNKINNNVSFQVKSSSNGISKIECNYFRISSNLNPFSDNGQTYSSHYLSVKNNYFDYFQNYGGSGSISLISNTNSNILFSENYFRNAGLLSFTSNGGIIEYKNNVNRDSSFSGFGFYGDNKKISCINNILSRSVHWLGSSIPGFLFKNNLLKKVQVDGSINTSGIGISIGKNSQGFEIDTYYNILTDSSYSYPPTIIAGTPMYGTGVDGANIGFDPKGMCLEPYFPKNNIVTDLSDYKVISQIYPNPFKDQLIIENKSNEQITVSDVSGRVMFAGQQMSEPINTQAWQSGMYFVKINNQVMKFVKE